MFHKDLIQAMVLYTHLQLFGLLCRTDDRGSPGRVARPGKTLIQQGNQLLPHLCLLLVG